MRYLVLVLLLAGCREGGDGDGDGDVDVEGDADWDYDEPLDGDADDARECGSVLGRCDTLGALSCTLEFGHVLECIDDGRCLQWAVAEACGDRQYCSDLRPEDTACVCWPGEAPCLSAAEPGESDCWDDRVFTCLADDDGCPYLYIVDDCVFRGLVCERGDPPECVTP